MNSPNPPPAGTDPVVAAQMLVLQQMTNVVNEMQERQEMCQDRLEMQQAMRQARLERRQQQHPLPPPPPAAPASYIYIYISITICKISVTLVSSWYDTILRGIIRSN
jgi:hypothetical protein